MRPRTGGRTGTELILVGIGRCSPRSAGTRPYPGHQLLERQVARTDPVCGIVRRLAQPRRRNGWGSREMQSLLEAAATYLNTLGPRDMVWIGIGFLGQFLFMMRFLWQWIQSERQRRSIIPIAFWYFSLAGGMTLFAYAVHRRDPVFITGQSLGLLVYARNLLLIGREKRASPPPA